MRQISATDANYHGGTARLRGVSAVTAITLSANVPTKARSGPIATLLIPIGPPLTAVQVTPASALRNRLCSADAAYIIEPVSSTARSKILASPLVKSTWVQLAPPFVVRNNPELRPAPPATPINTIDG